MELIDIARTVHEANRVLQAVTGEEQTPPWDEAPEWAQDSTLKGVIGVLGGNTPEMSHEGWCEERLSTGWVYGPVKDTEKKIHPCLVPYEQLPEIQKAKDDLFVSITRSLARHLD